MKFRQRYTTVDHWEQSLADFLFAGDLASEVCQFNDTSPGAILLDNLVANRWPGENFEQWLLRQVREILVQHVQTDDWEEESQTRTQQTVEAIELCDEDRDWLLARFAQHPEVLAVWEEACRDEHIRQIAA